MDMVLVGGTANPDLNKKIAKKLGVGLAKVKVDHFADGETYVRFLDDLHDKDVYIIQPTSTPANENLMELLIMIDAAKRTSVGRISVIMPYMGYSRQERKAFLGEPITAKLVADLITTAGAEFVVLVDIHAESILGFFDLPVEHVDPVPVFANEYRKLKVKDVVVVSPDAGAMKKNKALADLIGADFSVMMKHRKLKGHDTVAEMIIIGNVKGKNVVMIDDIISTAGTICKASEILKENGAKDIYVMATHPVLVGPAIERLRKAPIKKVMVGDTIPLGDKKLDNIEVVSFAPVLAEVIKAQNGK